MEEQNINTQPQTTPPAQTQTAVPGAIVAFVFGIISICTFYLGAVFVAPGLIPLIFGIIGWSKGKKAEKIYAENPASYVKAHGVFAKIGKILGLIGWILAIVFMVIFLIILLGETTHIFD
ncbi:MAG TPA: hypothetical protein PKN48_01310 [Bacteroidales bacterium]|nr:hypothetical protein [Bacteroidales bacterium]